MNTGRVTRVISHRDKVQNKSKYQLSEKTNQVHISPLFSFSKQLEFINTKIIHSFIQFFCAREI